MFYDIMKFKKSILCHELYTILKNFNHNFLVFDKIYI